MAGFWSYVFGYGFADDRERRDDDRARKTQKEKWDLLYAEGKIDGEKYFRGLLVIEKWDPCTAADNPPGHAFMRYSLWQKLDKIAS